MVESPWKLEKAFIFYHSLQFDLLAQFFGVTAEEDTTCHAPTPCDLAYRLTSDLLASCESPAMVGSQPSQVESSKDLPMRDQVLFSHLTSDTDAVLNNIALDSILQLEPEGGVLPPDSELEKLLHPFASSIVESERENWDIESLFTL